MFRIVVVLACISLSTIGCASPVGPTGGNNNSNGNTGGSGNTGGGTPGSGTSSNGGSSTGLRTVKCGIAGNYDGAAWVTMPTLGGFDVKFFYNGVFNSAYLNFRNRYRDKIHFSYELYAYGPATPPRTTYRHSMAASSDDVGPIGYGSTSGVARGGQVCVVIEQVRFGATDAGPYYNPD